MKAKTEKINHLRGPENKGEKGFILLYDERSVVKPFFNKITKESAQTAVPADVTLPVKFQ